LKETISTRFIVKLLRYAGLRNRLVNLFVKVSVRASLGSGGPYLCHSKEMNLQRTIVNIASQEIRLSGAIVNIARQLGTVCCHAQAL